MTPTGTPGRGRRVHGLDSAGLVHLSYLMWFHNGAMANGADWPLDGCTAEQIAAFTAAATYFELDEIADLIGRLAPDDALSHEYWDLSSPFGEDASLIRDALRCKLVEAPRDWVQRQPRSCGQ